MPPPHAPLRKPAWLKVRLPGGEEYRRVRDILAGGRLHTICREARCPNIAECFHMGTATFLILGDICTRHCRYCNVKRGAPAAPDPGEPQRLAEAAQALGLRYVVITSVTRDDLPDGGASHFAACIGALRLRAAERPVEVLVPDFRGKERALERVLTAGPAVINHNLEVAPALFRNLRPEGDYGASLALLRRAKEEAGSGIATKSGFMVGFGETREDILMLLEDLASVRCDRLTIGQYQQPTRRHWPVMKYYHPDEFAELGATARHLGFGHVEAGPLVRSSYRAAAAEDPG